MRLRVHVNLLFRWRRRDVFGECLDYAHCVLGLSPAEQVGGQLGGLAACNTCDEAQYPHLPFAQDY